jgi:hypothetical protein
MQHGQVLQLNILFGIMQSVLTNTLGTMKTPKAQIQLARNYPTRSDFLICMGTFGNGLKIVGIQITPVLQMMEVLG